ncbi:MAG TPA: aromatic ring-hydroxylating dioxygenase subunit alpha [Acidimicrobiia bacterium]|nr:aromatic ring-hydroxylating dioxygenase subunit alpha [Acidimicrobiia bacterium]
MTAIDPQVAISERSGGRSVQDYLGKDPTPAPELFRTSQPGFFGTADIPKERYLSPDWHHREMERMWARSWQAACHSQEIPEVGDHTIYEVGCWSFLVVRTAPDTVKAFYNACQHRGTKLKIDRGHSTELRCPFHGWTWDLDGRLRTVPGEWDFPQLDRDAAALCEVRADTWGGFVFICLDPEAPTLQEWIGPLPDHFESLPYEQRRLVAHVRRILPCNWKLGLEAFLESYHVPSTHPQNTMNTNDLDTQYDILSERVNRMITLVGVPGPTVGYDLDDQEILDSLAESGMVGPDGKPLQVPDGMTARQVLGEFARAAFSYLTGADLTGLSISELIDGHEYHVFPNFVPWAGLGIPFAYTFTPYGDDPDRCVWDVYVLWPHPAGEPFPPVPPVRFVNDDELYSAVQELSWVGPLFDQDMENLRRFQQGMKTLPKPGLIMSSYQESRIRHYHHLLEQYVCGE